MIPFSGDAAKDADAKKYFGMIGCADGYEIPVVREMVDAVIGRGNARVAGRTAVRRSLVDEVGYTPPNGREPMYDIVFTAYEARGRIASVIKDLGKIEGVDKVVYWPMVGDNYKWETPKKGNGAD